MVRSLQASRNSLDGAGLSSASLGRKLNRPFSPSLSRKGLNPLRNSSSSPFVLEQFEKNPSQVIVTTSPEAEPVIETPLSPEREDHPSSFNFGGEFEFQNSGGNNVFVVDENNVEIEDITDQDFSCEIETMIQDFDTVLKQSELDDIDDETLLTRPSHLNLSGSSPKKASYAFNSRIGWLLLKALKKRSQELEEAEEFYDDADVAELQNAIHATSNAGDNIENDDLIDYDQETFLERPDYLDLTGEDQKIKPSYYFNSRIGSLLLLGLETALPSKVRKRPSKDYSKIV